MGWQSVTKPVGTLEVGVVEVTEDVSEVFATGGTAVSLGLFLQVEFQAVPHHLEKGWGLSGVVV